MATFALNTLFRSFIHSYFLANKKSITVQSTLVHDVGGCQPTNKHQRAFQPRTSHESAAMRFCLKRSSSISPAVSFNN